MCLRNTGAFRLIFPALLILLLAGRQAGAQQEISRIWQDGTPIFNRIAASSAVQVDSIIQLIFVRDQSTERDGFSLHLTGVDRIYNSTAQALDFNTLPDRQDLYLITDAFARRLFVVRASDGTEINEFRGPTNPDSALSSPVDGRVVLQNNARKLLVTDRARHRVFKFDFDDKSTIWFYPPPGTPAAFQLLEPAATVAVRAVPDSMEIAIVDRGNNRILWVAIPDSNASGFTVQWNWGQGVLNDPVDLEISDGLFLITDRGNNRVLVVRPTGLTGADIVYQYPPQGTAVDDSLALKAPEDAQFLSSGRLLIADTGNQRLIEVDTTTSTITWRFLGRLVELRSANRLSDGKTLVISRDPRNPESTRSQPTRLGYATQTFVSTINVLGQPVDFESISWRVNQPIGTGVRFQLRTANSTGELVEPDSLWLGPTGKDSYYEVNDSPTNPLHDGKQIFQYRVELSTNNPLLTPEITNVIVRYRFYNPDVAGLVTSEVIRDTTGRTVISWDELQFVTRIPSDPSQRDDIQLEVQILDGETNAVLESFQASNTSTVNLRTLTGLSSLRGKQSIRLQAAFETNNASVSPVLDSWQVRWRTTTTTKSAIRFTDSRGHSIEALRTVTAAQAQPGNTAQAFIELRDQNLIPVFDLIDVKLRTTASGDSESVQLKRQPTGEYILTPGIPVVVQEQPQFVFRGNQVIEAGDRDSLVVEYRDPTSTAEIDVASDTLLVMKFTRGALFVATRVDTIPIGARLTFNDTLYLRVIGERDRDFSPAQDTISAVFFDNITTDRETVILFEQPNDAGGNIFSTGNFFSIQGIPLKNSAVGIRNDRMLQTRPNHEIGARYIDNDTLTVVYQLEADTSGGGGETFIIGDGAFDFFFAPNPFRLNSGQTFRLRMEAYTGDVTLEKIEIYNLAGERVRTVDISQIDMDRGVSIRKESRSTSRNQWWDLRSENDALISSGTYWAKFYVRFDDGIQPPGQRILIRKFIVIQ